MVREPQWNVIIFDHNTGKRCIRYFNIFNSYYFYNRLINIKKEMKKHQNDFEWFDQELNSAAFGAFCSKFEYEIMISQPFFESADDALKIDVYYQLKINWHIFSQYVWENIKYIKKSKTN